METYYFASTLEPRSLEWLLQDSRATDDFLNGPHSIVDIREVQSGGKRKLVEAVTNVKFSKGENKVLIPVPKSQKDVFNSIHALGIYYELSSKQDLKDGFVFNGKIYDKKGGIQDLKPPKIEFSDKIQNPNDKLVLDAPLRVDISRSFEGEIYALGDTFVDNSLVREHIENVNQNAFVNYNQGTDFIIINPEVKSVKDIIKNFNSSLYSKFSQVIKHVAEGEADTNYAKFSSDSLEKYHRQKRNIEYVDFMSYEEKYKLLKKWFLGERKQDYRSENEGKSLEERVLNDYYHEILLSQYLDFSSKQFISHHEDEFRELVSKKAKEYSGKFRVEGFTETLQLFDYFNSYSEANDFLDRNSLNKYIDSWMQIFKECFEEENGMLGGGEISRNEAVAVNEYKKLNINGLKFRAIKKRNERLALPKNFKVEEIIQNMKNFSFFGVPTFIMRFKNKQYNRFIEELDKVKTPYVDQENVLLVYDVVRSKFSESTILEKTRKEFMLNFPNKDKNSFKSGFYNKDLRQTNYYARLWEIDKSISKLKP